MDLTAARIKAYLRACFQLAKIHFGDKKGNNRFEYELGSFLLNKLEQFSSLRGGSARFKGSGVFRCGL